MTVYRGRIISYHESVDTVQCLNGPYIWATELSFGAPESARRDLSDGGIESFRGGAPREARQGAFGRGLCSAAKGMEMEAFQVEP